MARLAGSVIAGVILFAASLYQLVLSRFIHVQGAFRAIEPFRNEACEVIRGVSACEELSVHSHTGLVYLACSTPENRRQWLPFDLNFKQPSTQDYIALYDPISGNVRRLEIKGLEDSRGLNVHGFHIVPSRVKPKTEAFVYVVNHRPQPLGNEADLGADSVIELFKTMVGSDTLQHVFTFESNVIMTPNDLVGSPDGDSVYFTNDHGSKTGKFGRTLQLIFNLRKTSVGYCSIKEGCKLAATGLKGSNGIAQFKDTVYVGDTFDGIVSVFERQTDNSLVLTTEVNIGRGLDNLSVDQEGSVYAATFVNVVETLKHLGNSSHPSPSSVFKISLNTGHSSYFGKRYTVEKIFEDDGTTASVCTSAVMDIHRKRLYLSGPYMEGFVACKTE